MPNTKSVTEVVEHVEDNFTAVDKTGAPADLSVLEEAGVAYDPTRMPIDLSHAEKRRTTALMMAIQAYQNLIIKDAEYLREAYNQHRVDPEAPTIKPATMNAMVEAALDFDDFISGKLQKEIFLQREEIRDAPEAAEKVYLKKEKT